ncbi:MAG: hypothetical protein ACR2PL_05255 [Dehalococcoidia bacterium]
MTVQHREEQAIESILTGAFEPFCKNVDLEPFVVAADKHGSIVWDVVWRERLKYSVMLSLTQVSDSEDNIEVGFAADDGYHFTTRRYMYLRLLSIHGEFLSGGIVHGTTGAVSLSPSEIMRNDRKYLFLRLHRSIFDYLREASYQALSLKQTDLTESYIIPR